MADSVQILHGDPEVYRIHSQQKIGKVYKGHVIRQAQSTIPSKYHTVVIENTDKRGFNSTGKRFSYDPSTHVTPSPNHYGWIQSSVVSSSPSLSKKGTGGFASKSSRTLLASASNKISPGPGMYDVNSPGLRKDFNSANTASFHQPIAVQRETQSGAPSPSSYDPLRSIATIQKNNLRDLNSVFKSSSKRQLINLSESASKPGPASYTVSNADRILAPGDRVPVSCFKQSGQRNTHLRRNSNPGPGAYDHEAVGHTGKRLIFPMQHYLCLSAPALPLPETPPLPGPGQYQVAKRPISKHYMTSSMFLSNTSRWTGNVADRNPMPGPAHYHPQAMNKQNFAYNANAHWAL